MFSGIHEKRDNSNPKWNIFFLNRKKWLTQKIKLLTLLHFRKMCKVSKPKPSCVFAIRNCIKRSHCFVHIQLFDYERYLHFFTFMSRNFLQSQCLNENSSDSISIATTHVFASCRLMGTWLHFMNYKLLRRCGCIDWKLS